FLKVRSFGIALKFDRSVFGSWLPRRAGHRGRWLRETVIANDQSAAIAAALYSLHRFLHIRFRRNNGWTRIRRDIRADALKRLLHRRRGGRREWGRGDQGRVGGGGGDVGGWVGGWWRGGGEGGGLGGVGGGLRG